MTTKIEQTHLLRDGRTLGYAEYGDVQGKPVFYFHGGNDSRLSGQWLDEAAQTLQAHIYAPDRPGFGLSTFQPDRELLGWPDDMVELADTLGIDRFSVMGISGGGPFVAACAYRIPERLKAAAIVSGASPYAQGVFKGMFPPVRLIFLVARYAPRLLNLLHHVLINNPRNFVKNIPRLPNLDGNLLTARPAVGEIFVAGMEEGHRPGLRGAVYEWQLYVRPWGFALEDIRMEVYLWYGEGDVNVPPAMGRYLAAALPNARVTFFPEEGHFSTLNNHVEEILTPLIA